MSRDWRSQNNFGLSWGFPGLRVGRSQYGTWWVSIGLPLGFRITKRLGKSRNPLVDAPSQASEQLTDTTPVQRLEVEAPNPLLDSGVTAKNRKILARMKKLS